MIGIDLLPITLTRLSAKKHARWIHINAFGQTCVIPMANKTDARMLELVLSTSAPDIDVVKAIAVVDEAEDLPALFVRFKADSDRHVGMG